MHNKWIIIKVEEILDKCQQLQLLVSVCVHNLLYFT